MSTFAQRVVLFTALAIWIIGYNLWQFAWHNFYYHCVAITWVLLFILVRDLVKDKWLSVGANVGVAIAINNLLDELFFNPAKFGFNEYFFTFVSILIIYRNGRKEW